MVESGYLLFLEVVGIALFDGYKVVKDGFGSVVVLGVVVVAIL